MQKYLEQAGVEIRFGTEVTNVRFEINGEKKTARAIECLVHGEKTEIPLTEKDLVFITNGSCTEGTIYGDQKPCAYGQCRDPHQRLLGAVEADRRPGPVLRTSGEILLRYSEDQLGICNCDHFR